ncbi:Mur ligase family protein [Isachenkonia alkalipeptolytica]|uniref:UDP-N-acetylmuramyl-tripeptide synthetase n=1 Tax=Isachenkonia alkalipeptolytica TaxID=2565777 RepID=A0AA43XJZ3_9CLOT|nr:UDP-N-acetylmuramyl-tripeptide synthetase [Isachenkonia alkalipeptolytica]NBG88027.1 UDP-N-acetylmuramyl-tripeptide synthetase [Isachenkonia alkalipeptolytica]
MRLKEILEFVESIEHKNHGNIEISGLSYHSKETEPGDLFFCIKGYETDGHKYLQDAVNNGAVAAVVEEIQQEIAIPQIKVSSSRIALARSAANFYDHPSRKLNAIGITATNGKTTTSFMAHKILKDQQLEAGIIGTVMVQYRDKKIPSLLTTPESLDLQKHFSNMVKEEVSHVTMEVSSSAQELHRVEAVDFDIVTLNNISREHIDSHGSFERYFEVKSRLITRAKKDSAAVLNLDDSYSKGLITKTKAKVFTFGIEDSGGDFAVKDLDLSTGRGVFTLAIQRDLEHKGVRIPKGEMEIRLSVPGFHSVYNSVVAAIIGLLSGVDQEGVRKSLKDFRGVERRFEFIYEEDFKVVDDHFANAGNIHMTLGTLKEMNYNNLHVLYAIRGKRGIAVNRENTEALVQWLPKLGVRELIATESVSHVMEKDRVTQEERRVFEEVTGEAGIPTTIIQELPQAIERVMEKAKPGDVVLLAGCQGMDYGGEIALHLLAKGREPAERERILAPLTDRVAGIS